MADLNRTLLIHSEAEIVLEKLPNKPFLCLLYSAVFYAMLKDNYGIDAKLITGHLTFKDHFIFKQDFSLLTGDHSKFKLRAGHAWVEVDGVIWDLSFFRTFYSDKFQKPYRNELLKLWGIGQEFIVTNSNTIADKAMTYYPVDTLTDEMATSITQNMEQLLKMM